MNVQSHISENLITLTSANHLNNLRTGYVIIDTILVICLIALLPTLNEYLKDLFSKIPDWSWLRRNRGSKIILVGFDNPNGKFGPRQRFSSRFRAVTRYIEKQRKAKVLLEYFSDSYGDKETYLRPISAIPLKVTSSISYVVRERETGNIELELCSDNSVDDIHAFIDEAIRSHDEYMDREISTRRYYFCPKTSNEDSLIRWNRFPFDSNKSFSNIFFPRKKEILTDIEKFETGEKLYASKGVPWQLGILLYGVPGTGKSSFVKALAAHTKRHIIEIPLGQIESPEELRIMMLGQKIDDYNIPHSKRLYLIEDIDCLDDVVCSRKTAKTKSKEKEKEAAESEKSISLFSSFDTKDKSSKLKLSHILNIIDGALEAPGRMLVITTNYPEKLDEALTRDGRMDIKLEMKPIQSECLTEMILHLYPEKTAKDIARYLPLENKNRVSPATVQRACMKYTFEETCDMLQ